MTTYYKATTPHGTDSHTGKVNYAAALESGEPLTHGAKLDPDDPSTYFSVSTVPTGCVGFRWPARLFVVEPHKCRPRKRTDGRFPNKRALRSLRVIEERPAHELFGPQGEEVVAIIERAGRLTAEEVRRLYASRDASRAAAWDAARYAAWDASRDASRAASRAAAWAASRAALATITRDLIGKHGYTQEHHDLLMEPWRKVIEKEEAAR